MQSVFILRLFFVCLCSCAGLVIFFIWAGGPPSERFAQIAATLFVIGLASFLVWFVGAMKHLGNVANLKK